jgi:hypothetical protein
MLQFPTREKLKDLPLEKGIQEIFIDLVQVPKLGYVDF